MCRVATRGSGSEKKGRVAVRGNGENEGIVVAGVWNRWIGFVGNKGTKNVGRLLIGGALADCLPKKRTAVFCQK